MTEIEKALREEIREKKKISNSVHSKKGKRGYVGTMRTPADLLTGVEKRAYTQSSPVSTTNIYYDQIMSLEEFKALSRQKKMLVLDAYKRRFKASEIATAWNCSQANVHNYYTYYLKNPSADKPKTRHADKQNAESPPQEKAKQAALESECSFTLSGEFEALSLGRKLNGLAFMLDDRLRYQVEIHVKEIPGR